MELECIEEGQYVEGLKHGYCRVISAVDGSCEVGFFEEDMPRGKFCKFAADGSYEKPEGLYEGEKCTKIVISTYKSRISRTQE